MIRGRSEVKELRVILYNVSTNRGSDSCGRNDPWLAGVLLLCTTTLILVLRASLLTLLLILRPLVSFVLSATAVLAVFTALALETSAAAEMFPFWGMIAFSLACAALLALYQGLLRFLSQ